MFYLPLFSPSTGISRKSSGWTAGGTIFTILIWTQLWGRAAVPQQHWNPGWNPKPEKGEVWILGSHETGLGEKIQLAPADIAPLPCLETPGPNPKPHVPQKLGLLCGGC